MPTQQQIRIATRGSQLALWQAHHVKSLLEQKGLRVELNIIKTTGDRVQDRFLHEMGGKGLFVRELEEAMQKGEADLAVHSLKDLPARLPAGFTLAAILPRHLACDVLIMNEKKKHLFPQKPGQKINKTQLEALGPLSIATASLRRQSLLKGLSSKPNLVAVRGNVDTRIRKLNEGDWDGLILAGASLERLSWLHLPHYQLDESWFVPCAAQGALAIETPESSPLKPLLQQFSDARSYAAATIERLVLEKLGGDCTMPFGAYLRAKDDGKASLAEVLVLNYEGAEAKISLSFPQPPEQLNPEATAQTLLSALQQKGVTAILQDLKIKVPDLGEIHS